MRTTLWDAFSWKKYNQCQVLIHQGWGKPTKHEVWWLFIMFRLNANAQLPPLGSFTLGDVILWIMGHFRSLWHLLRHHSYLLHAVKSILTHQKELMPSGWTFWYFSGGEFSQLSHWCKDFGMIKSTTSLGRICLLSASSLIFFNTQLQPLVVGVHPSVPAWILCTLLAKHPAGCLSH